ncbi:hypothetical protein V8G54_010884 [Vigna mungo]|uniref:Retrovirus-related Pol polyprotein from transposon TNT 1-94-like beta-barrel domain-containing protein n=1 Tax=Vigna mungo TaxID=3915 RepID=A0AAQ3P018_VIGMU
MVLQHEREFIGISLKPFVPDSLAFAALSNDQPCFHSSNRTISTASKINSKNNKICEQCKKTNHTIETCYFRIGFPAGYKNSKPNKKAFASLVVVDSSVCNHTNYQFTLSKDQYQAILALLQHTKDHSSSVNHASVHNSGTTSTSPHWIIDSGATDHICPIQSLFHKLQTIKAIRINLPNHTTVISSFSGTIHIGALLLIDVIFVHEFSNSQLTMIGVARKVDGLYCFEESYDLNPNKVSQSSLINKSTISISYAIRHVVHLTNRLPTPFLENQSPYQYVFGSIPDFSTLRVFGCLAFANTIMDGRTKLEKRASKFFYEFHFPYARYSPSLSHHHNTSPTASQQIFYSLIALDIHGSHFTIAPSSSSPNIDNTAIEPVMQFNDDSNDVVQVVDQPPRVSNRDKPLFYLSAYDCPTLSSANISYSTPYPLHSYLSYSNCSNSHTTFCTSLSATIEPLLLRKLISMIIDSRPCLWKYKLYREIASVKLTTVRFLLSIVVSRNCDLDEDIYMRPPLGLLLREPNLSSTDHSLFTQHSSDSFIALLVYVEDIVPTGDNMHVIIIQGLVLKQRKYCLEILAKFGLTGCKPTNSPSNPTVKLKDDEGDFVSDPIAYRRLIGKLQYLTNTRPDISFVVQQVTQFMSKPRQSHLYAAFRILKYLKGCPNLGLFYPSSNPHIIQAFSGSD